MPALLCEKYIQKASAGNVRRRRTRTAECIKIEATATRVAAIIFLSACARPPNYYTAMANRKLDSRKAINLNLHAAALKCQ